MEKVIFTRGCPASGKTTWSKKFVLDNPDYIRVNRDDLRRMAGKYWLPERESVITGWEIITITTALCQGYNVVVDGTNMNETHVNCLLDQINKTVGIVEIEYKDFLDVSLEELIKRDRNREHYVGEKVITNFYNKYIKK